MRTIWKYPINLGALMDSTPIPTGAKFLHLGDQDGTPCIWLEVENMNLYDRLYCVGTGHKVPQGADYVGTVIYDVGLVFHFYIMVMI